MIIWILWLSMSGGIQTIRYSSPVGCAKILQCKKCALLCKNCSAACWFGPSLILSDSHYNCRTSSYILNFVYVMVFVTNYTLSCFFSFCFFDGFFPYSFICFICWLYLVHPFSLVSSWLVLLVFFFLLLPSSFVLFPTLISVWVSSPVFIASFCLWCVFGVSQFPQSWSVSHSFCLHFV